MDALIFYKNNTYIVTLSLDMEAIEYAMYFKEVVKTDEDVQTILKNAIINNEADIHNFTHTFKFEEGKWYIYDYTFEYWECLDDYVDVNGRNMLPEEMVKDVILKRYYDFEV